MGSGRLPAGAHARSKKVLDDAVSPRFNSLKLLATLCRSDAKLEPTPKLIKY